MGFKEPYLTTKASLTLDVIGFIQTQMQFVYSYINTINIIP